MSVSSEPSFKGLPSIPAKVHFLVRGDPSNQREAVETGFPHVLVRKDAKKWITGAGDDGPVPGRVALDAVAVSPQRGRVILADSEFILDDCD